MKLVYFASLALSILLFSCQGSKEKPLNVLFIAVDDLRPDIGAYGNTLIKTPHLDRLAATGTIFESHYVQVPTCGASRCSIMTGLLPRQAGHLKNSAFEEFISDRPEALVPESLVHHFRRNGYRTVGIGKISHSVDGLLYGYKESPEGAKKEMPHSWDEFLFDADKWGTGWNAFFGYADGSNRQQLEGKVYPYEMADVEDRGYPDGITADLASEKLRELANGDAPFFLGVGFFKPHLPFTAPKKYWDLYSRDQIPLAAFKELPENVHLSSLQRMGEFNQYLLGDEKATLEKSLSDEYAQKLIHAYYASVSYVDAQIGKVLDELERLGLAKNTLVVVWGDHGWHLGEHRVWGKHTNFDIALRSPLIIRNPLAQPGRIGRETVVSSIDVYPTLADLCGLPVDFPLDGQSLVQLISTGMDSERENRAFSYFNKGISMRTDRYRITKYFREEQPSIELYDHLEDPHESINIALQRPELVEELTAKWQAGDTGLYVPQ
ncbi:iduronate-2-sulfatase [Lunatimonas lonarensis]|uniref:Iduronate-2-sulfatase n=2 Tax=Lunatimonas lonarensis TaxID=1232681 RepID=R7ZWG0_9BACT|nr:iduronate-2-sulfatase [Lunatimonas lonarensis]